MNHISDAFEDLSHALRVLLEADFRAREGLLQIDRAEAVGNIEAGLAAVLNAFHSIDDAMEKDGVHGLVDWYRTPELATVLVLRNARHHNLAKKIRTLYTYYIQEAAKVGSMEMYVLVDFPAKEEGGDTFDVYLSWRDLKILLALQQKESKIRPAVAQSIHDYLATSRFGEHANAAGLAEERVFFNAVPLFVNAAATLIPLIKHLISTRSAEGEAFLSLFEDLPLADTKNHEVHAGPVTFLP